MAVRRQPPAARGVRDRGGSWANPQLPRHTVEGARHVAEARRRDREGEIRTAGTMDFHYHGGMATRVLLSLDEQAGAVSQPGSLLGEQ